MEVSASASSIPASIERRTAALEEVARLRRRADQDPLLAPWSGPYGGVPPWDRVDLSRIGSSFELGLALLHAEIVAITADPEAPTFENTIRPLEDSGRHPGRLMVVFGVLSGNLNTPEVQKLDEEWSPRITEAFDAIVFDAELFRRIAAVHAARGASEPPLSAEQRRLVEIIHDDYVRAGAKLDAAQKRELGRLNQELTRLHTEFGNKVLADENTWIVLDGPDHLAGLSDPLREAYRAAAIEKGLPGRWVVVNTRSSVDPFLTESSRRDLREKVWKAFKDRGDRGGPSDTNATIAQIVKMRAERAQLLGFESHAHLALSDSMAREPKHAQALMLRVWPAALARVREEVADMQRIADREEAGITIEPWDYLYYAEQVRKQKYDLDQEELKPYFELGSMTNAAFWMAERLYGLTFREITGQVPVFEPEVRVWEVWSGAGPDGTGSTYVGLFYGDYFARATKRSGAWASWYRSHETFTGVTRTPILSNNNNFVKGAAGEPVLISLDDARTLFHEFGHALHGLLSETSYPGFDRTPTDFVEFPSQVHEMWVLTRPVLDRFAKHYRTGQPMPAELLAKIEAARKFNQGYATTEYLSGAIVDMELHMQPGGVIDPDTFERETLQRIGAPREVAMRHRLPHFNHLFAGGGYSAGYYSYLWSEVMDADAREAFTETGDVFDPATALRMRRYILAPGNMTDRAEAYRQFRGRDPEVGALLRKRGFPAGRE